MEITLQHIEDCPNRETIERRLTEVVAGLGIEATLRRQLVVTPEAAAEIGFKGSPTVLIDGVDPFPHPADPVGLGCRVYRTEQGLAGAPTADQLRRALASAPG